MRTGKRKAIAIVLLLALTFAPSPAQAEGECVLAIGSPDPCSKEGGILHSARFVMDRASIDAFNSAAAMVEQLQLDLESCEERAAEEEKQPGWGAVVLTSASAAAVGFAIGLFLGAGS